MKLYWVTTDDHHEDWFVIAPDARTAARFFEREEGYLRGDAMAEEVLTFPEGIATETWWPSEEQLLAVGARLLTDEGSRVVEIAGRRFIEGMLEDLIRGIGDDQFEKLGQGRPNRTNKKSVQ